MTFTVTVNFHDERDNLNGAASAPASSAVLGRPGLLGDADHRVRCGVDALGLGLRGRSFGDRAWLKRARRVARRVERPGARAWLELLACDGSLCGQWRL